MEPGGSCWFVAKYENAIWAVWHFVSPDGQTDLAYDAITTRFPNLEVTKGYANVTQVKNIPAEMDGWKVYCRFSNNAGSVDTAMAGITVRSASAVTQTQTQTTGTTAVQGAPVVTKSPTDETVEAGGSCWFVAKYENAIWAVWHFVSPDGQTDLAYDAITTRFPNVEVTKGFANITQVKNIPETMNGWKVYCRFSNNVGSTDTGRATITVKGKTTTQTVTQQTTPAPTPTAGTAAGLPVVTKSPTDETVEAGGSCWFVAKYENAIWAVWHFVSPDGQTDLAYDAVGTRFPNLEVTKGFASTTQLKNIPAEMNGWKAYCRFTNNAGSTDTGRATITVKAASGTATVVQTDNGDNHYALVTSMSKSNVEAVAASVRTAYLDGNWSSVSGMIRYPITILDTQLNDATAFLNFMSDKTVAYDDRIAMQNETCRDMFVNGQGICMGNGEIWLNDPNYMTGSAPKLEIIALRGIAAAAESQTPTLEAAYIGSYAENSRRLATITIGGSSDSYRVNISWPDGNGRQNSWFFTGNFDSNGVLEYSGCIKTSTTYDSSGNPVDTTVYTDGTGKLTFSASNGGLYWTDYKEGVADGTYFARI